MAENVYEGMFILDSNRYAQDPGGISGQVPKLIEKCGGAVLASRLWNEQKLAYPIRGQRKGTYWLTYFRIQSESLATLTRQSQLNDNILRNLFLKVDARLVDAMVAHATGTATEETLASEENQKADANQTTDAKQTVDSSTKPTPTPNLQSEQESTS